MNIKQLTTTLFAAGILLATANTSYASGNGYGQSNCKVIYGGGKVCATKIEFSIDKKVQTPNKGGEYVDNLSINDAKFAPNSEVAFKVTIKNTGDNKIEKLEVVDTLPQNMTFVSGAGTYNKDSNTVSYTINNFEKGATNEQTFVAKIAADSALPKDQATVCLTNNVKATDNNGSTATDSSAFCIERILSNKVYDKVPVTSVPSTGPGMLSLLGLIPAGLIGYKLRKNSKFN